MMDDHQFLQAKRPAMVPQERRAVLQKRHNNGGPFTGFSPSNPTKFYTT